MVLVKCTMEAELGQGKSSLAAMMRLVGISGRGNDAPAMVREARLGWKS